MTINVKVTPKNRYENSDRMIRRFIKKTKKIPKSDSASCLISEICGYENKFDPIEISEMIEKLDDESKGIIHQRFFESKTAKEIGQENGYGRETARRRIISAIEKLKQCLQN